MTIPNMDTEIKKFVKVIITHPILTSVVDQLEFELKNIDEGKFILMFGPTGVGKTTMQYRLIERLVERLPESERITGNIPFVRVEASAAEGTFFSWPGFYRELLRELHEPHIEKKISFDNNADLNWREKVKLQDLTLRECVLAAIKLRHPKVVFVDEAQALGKVGLGRKAQDQMECAKTLVNKSETTYVMTGTYEVLSLRNLSGQLSRRCAEIHFPRYQKTEEDIGGFQQILANLEEKLPIQPKSHLVNETEFFYYHSVGCLGILKELINRALLIAYDKKASQISMEMFEKASLPMDKLVVIATETVYAELKYQSLPTISDLKNILAPKIPQTSSQPKSHRGRKKPGTRNPKRTKLGDQNV